MVAAMSVSEDQQLAAKSNFLVSSRLSRSAPGARLGLVRPRLQWLQLRHQSLRHSLECRIKKVFRQRRPRFDRTRRNNSISRILVFTRAN